MAEVEMQANRDRKVTVLLTAEQEMAVEDLAWYRRESKSDLLRDRSIRWIEREYRRVKPEIDRARNAA